MARGALGMLRMGQGWTSIIPLSGLWQPPSPSKGTGSLEKNRHRATSHQINFIMSTRPFYTAPALHLALLDFPYLHQKPSPTLLPGSTHR